MGLNETDQDRRLRHLKNLENSIKEKFERTDIFNKANHGEVKKFKKSIEDDLTGFRRLMTNIELGKLRTPNELEEMG